MFVAPSPAPIFPSLYRLQSLAQSVTDTGYVVTTDTAQSLYRLPSRGRKISLGGGEIVESERLDSSLIRLPSYSPNNQPKLLDC
jgi:hypothetical protein